MKYKIIKKVIGIAVLMLIVAFYAVSSITAADSTVKSKIVDVRVGKHKSFHRLVLEFSAPAEYSLRRRSGRVTLFLRNTGIAFDTSRRVETALLSFKGARIARDKKGVVTIVDIEFEQGMKVEHFTESNPFRIIIDIYRNKEASGFKLNAAERVVKISTPEDEVKSLKKSDARSRKSEKKSESIEKKVAQKGSIEKKIVNNLPEKSTKEAADRVEPATLPTQKSTGTELIEEAVNTGELKDAVKPPVDTLVQTNTKGVLEQGSKKKPDLRKVEVSHTLPHPVSTALQYLKKKRKSSEHILKSGAKDSHTPVAANAEHLPVKHKSSKVKVADTGHKVTVKSMAENVHKSEPKAEHSRRGVERVEKVEKSRVLSGTKIKIGTLKNRAKSTVSGRHAVLSIKRLVREEAKKELLATRPKMMTGTVELLIAYNEGWRFIYRKKINKIIQAELYKENVIEWKLFKDVLNLAAFEPRELVKESTVLASRLEANGKTGRAAVVTVMAGMIETGSGAQELEGLLRIYPDTGLTYLGWVFLGAHYEKSGLYPEALAHYSRVVNEGATGNVKNSAHFAKARLLYLTGEFTKSKVNFRKLLSTGYEGAGMWLGNAYHMRGEMDRARALYEKYVPVELDSVDPITLMGVGDLRIKYGDNVGAAKIFKYIQQKYHVNDLALSFLRVREADALVVNSQPVKAQVIYTGAYKAFKGEARILSGLALADSMAMIDKGDSLMMADSFYHKLHRWPYVASQYAYFNMARVQHRLKLYRDAAITIDDFLEQYPTNEHRSEAIEIKAEVMYEWIKKLFAESDYFGVAEIVARYGAEIPFGKKGSTYYRIGKSYSELSLLSEAESTLIAAADIGIDRYAEKAMFELVNVYLKRKEIDRLEKLVKSFKVRFPNSTYKTEMNRMSAKAAYIKGDYKKFTAGVATTGEPVADFSRATALARINRHSEAIKIFLQIAKTYKAAKDVNAEKRALLGAADSSVKLNRYSAAVKYYTRAVELMGKEKSLEKRWALYKITQSYARMNKRAMQKEALKETVVANGLFGDGAAAIYKDDFR